jgi:hypothetical protein
VEVKHQITHVKISCPIDKPLLPFQFQIVYKGNKKKSLPKCLEACHMLNHHFYVILCHYHWETLWTCKAFIAFILVPYFELKCEY